MHFRVLAEVLDIFQAASIPVIVLKGAALAHVLYPSIDLRPLGDLDLLVAPASASRAQSALAAAGFVAPLPQPGGRFAGHHHLPAAVTRRDGRDIMVEVHTHALSRDAPGALSIDRLSDAPQPFEVAGRTTWTLGHLDMLHHLSRHAAQPAPLLRLIWIADLVGYATRYRETIPWEDLRRRRPGVLTALSLLHCLAPLPPELSEYIPRPDARGLQGVGTVCKPLSEIFERGRDARDIRRDIFDPSDWWIRLYYGAEPASRLWWYRSVRHPLQVLMWLARRALRPRHEHAS